MEQNFIELTVAILYILNNNLLLHYKFHLVHIGFQLFEIGTNMAEGGTGNADKETAFLSELIGNKSVTAIPGIEQAHAIKLRGKGVRKVIFSIFLVY